MYVLDDDNGSMLQNSEDSCCHDALQTSLDFLGKYGSGTGLNFADLKPDTYVCTQSNQVSTKVRTAFVFCGDARSAAESSSWPSIDQYFRPGTQVRSFTCRFEQG